MEHLATDRCGICLFSVQLSRKAITGLVTVLLGCLPEGQQQGDGSLESGVFLCDKLKIGFRQDSI